ncbi:hypothetical protein F4804DRAFT_132481 [Jackrogersella minutella]|nr:hypothetical protein F4804DRAFT_132481 [Jackrogersella minutella]
MIIANRKSSADSSACTNPDFNSLTMDNEFQGERDPQDQEHLFEQFEADDESYEYIEDQGWCIDWETWWQIIVHRNAGIPEPDPPNYPEGTWSLDEKEAPFPFNLEETWYCATILILLLAIHCELDTAWLLQHGYRHYFLRISSRTILTVAISFLSTLLFEVFGNVLDLTREALIDRILFYINSWFVERLGWGPVNDQGRADWDGHFVFYRDTTYLREPIRNAVGNTAVLIFNYSAMILSYTIPVMIGSGIIWLASLISTDLGSLMSNLSTTLALPTPGMNGTSELRDLLWEFGVPAFLQLWAAAIIYLSVFLFMSRAETPIILRRGGQDPFSKLAFQLLRATTAHLLAYTAYQIVCLCVAATPPFGFSNKLYKSLTSHRLIRKSMVQFSPGAGMLVIASHWLVRNVCKLLVRLCWPLSVPYIVWLSIKTEISTWQNWTPVYRPLLDEDMEVLNTDKRVTARAAMTSLFGLKSSWPARMRLSDGNDVD